MARTVDLLTFEVNPRLPAALRVAFGLLALVKGFLLVAFQSPPAVVMLPWMALGFALTVGWYARVAAGGLVALAWTLMLQGFYSNHFYLLSILLLLVALSDCERHYAIRRRGTGPAPGWPIFLMRAQLSIVYVFAGLSKLNGEFLTGRTLQVHFENSAIPLPDLAAFVVPLSLAAVTAEVFIGVGVWSDRLRPWALALILPLHALMPLVSESPRLVAEIILFGGMMCVLAASFLDVEEGDRLIVWDDGSPRWWHRVRALRRIDAFGALHFARRSEELRYRAIGARPGEPEAAVHLFLPGWRVLSGPEAVREIVRVLPGGNLIAAYLELPGIRSIGGRVAEPSAAERSHSPSGISARPV